MAFTAILMLRKEVQIVLHPKKKIKKQFTAHKMIVIILICQ